MQRTTRLRGFIETKHTRTIIDFSIITSLAIVVFRGFLFTSEWPAGGDVLGWISRAYLFGKDFRWLYIWRPQSFGFTEGINSMDLFLMLLHSLCKDASTTIKIFMFSSFLVAGFSIYAFTYHYSHRHLPALSASMIYCLNQWFFSQFTEAHVDILFSYALAPLVFLALDRALERKKFKDTLVLALALSLLATGFHPECAVIYGFFLAMFIVFFLLSPAKKPVNTRLRIINAFKFILPTISVCFLLSTPFFIPLLSNVKPPYYSATFGYPIEDAERHSYSNMTDAFTLRAIENWGYKFTVDVYKDLGLPDFPIYTLLSLIFLLAFCTAFLRSDRYTTFFAFSILVSIFISKGPHPPFGYIFNWMWFNVPYFAAFRAAGRSSMMTSLSLAFLVSVLVSILVDCVQGRRHTKMEGMTLKIEDARGVSVSVDFFNRAMKSINRLLYYSSLLLLTFTFMSGFLSCFYFFSQGLQVYTPPERYIKPYNWLAEQPEDCKLVTISNSESEWMNLPKQESDFAAGGMVTDIGWSHDIGYDSSFIHDKPVLQDGGWNPSARALISHLRFHVVRNHLTGNFLKIIGPFAYKYIVLPEYLSNNTRSFFLHQHGYHIVYDQNSLILQNDYYTPNIFTTNQYVYVLGGLESFESLSKLDKFNLNKTTLFFAHQLQETSIPSSSTFSNSEALIFVNSDIIDAVMLHLKNHIDFIKASDYGLLSLNYSRYWVRSTSWTEVGGFVWGGNTLTTCGKNTVSIPFTVDSNGVYDVWVRIGFTDNRGKLSISIDRTQIGEVKPLSKFWSGLVWLNVASINLDSGDHTITLTNDGTGYNDVDVIAIVDKTLLQTSFNEITDALKKYSGRIMFVLGAENTFTFKETPGWTLNFKDYEGFTLKTDGTGYNVSPEGNVSASSFGTWDRSYPAHLATDGDPNTRWASKPPDMPQWLQVEWESPQELIGVHVLFERAYAQDYAIQTWNGTGWVNQVNVTGNTELERYHYFPPVKSDKLRIYVTSAPTYELVSIWELEAYTTSWASINLNIPRSGRYVFAFRLASGPEYGNLSVKVDDQAGSVECFNSTPQGFVWREAGPFSLDEGNHTLTIGGFGKIDLDQIILYSLKEDEEYISVDDVFKPAGKPPEVEYERINPCEYRVRVSGSEGPFLLVFSESYHPLWRAYVDGTELEPINAYYVVNAFQINRTGDFNVTIYFTGQRYADMGIKVSLATFIAVAVLLAVPSSVFKREFFEKFTSSE